KALRLGAACCLVLLGTSLRPAVSQRAIDQETSAGEATLGQGGWVLTNEDRQICAAALTRCVPVMERLREQLSDKKELEPARPEVDLLRQERDVALARLEHIRASWAWKMLSPVRYVEEWFHSPSDIIREIPESERMLSLKTLLRDSSKKEGKFL